LTSAATGASPDFDRSVFVNCPFDAEYQSLLRPLLFTIAFFGFKPRIALERLDSLESRLEKICGLIRESKLSIHDLSRLKSTKAKVGVEGVGSGTRIRT
jgi:hypothetical protein